MADTWYGLGDNRIKLVDLGDSTYGFATGSYPQAGGDARRAFKVVPVVQTTPAYSSGDLVGGKQSVASFASVAGGSVLLEGITLANKVLQGAPESTYDFIFFDADPTATTFTENGPLTVNATDLFRVIDEVRITPTAGSTLFKHATNMVYTSGSLNRPLVLAAANTTLYFAVLIQTNGITYTTVGDLQITFHVRQD